MPALKIGVYQHFRGQYYLVLDTARHSETEDLHVVYKPLYGDDPELWVRPLKMFTEKVKHNGIFVSRFSFVSDSVDTLPEQVHA